jgi:hemoglobin
MRTQQISEDGIRHLVDAFYAKVRVDPELAPFFERALGNSPLATMYDFWSSVMLISGRYKGNRVEKHRRLNGIEPRLFDRWLQLFGETCNEVLEDDVAPVFRAKAARIAESLKLALFYRPDRPWPKSAS